MEKDKKQEERSFHEYSGVSDVSLEGWVTQGVMSGVFLQSIKKPHPWEVRF